MSRVRSSKNRTTELRLIEIFKKYSIVGWRRNYPLFGKPDFVFISSKTAIFVDGCFWHGHNCRNVTPKVNKSYWRRKIHLNKKRDAKVLKIIKSKGWDVIRIWECELKNSEKIAYKVNQKLIK